MEKWEELENRQALQEKARRDKKQEAKRAEKIPQYIAVIIPLVVAVLALINLWRIMGAI